MNDQSSFVEIGGARIRKGWVPMNFSAPFAKMECSQEQIIIRIDVLFYRRAYVFQKADIDALVHHDGLFSKGIRICHHSAELPEFVVFWTRNRKQLGEGLRQLNYDLRES
jgi:hypothetical protein